MRFFLVLYTLILTNPALSNRLADAAERGTASLITIVQASSSVGVLVGSVLMILGLAHMGKTILLGSLFGVFCGFGGASIVEMIAGWF